MALTTVTKVFGIDDLQLFPITADTSTTYTAGSAIDVVGVKKLSIDFQIDEKDLTGDEVVLDVHSKIKKATFSVDYGKMSLDVLAKVLGADLVASGTTPNQKQTLSLLDSNLPGYFQMQGKIRDVEAGSLKIVLFKCKCSASPIGGNEGDYATFSLNGNAVFTTKQFTRNSKTGGILLDMVLEETETAIAAITS